MQVKPAQPRRLTPQEYLAIERAADRKSDYCNGEMFDSAGGSSPHARIAANLITALGRRLEGRDCGTYTSDMRVHTPATTLYVYPDVSVVCGEEQFSDEIEDCIVNPCLLAEILSPSTQEYDRKKFFHYQHLATLDDFLLIHQDRAWTEHYVRPTGQGEWTFKLVGHPEDPVAGLQAKLDFSALGVEIPLKEIYRRIKLEPFLPPGPQ